MSTEHVEQPMPTPNDGISIQMLVRADLHNRERVGREVVIGPVDFGDETEHQP